MADKDYDGKYDERREDFIARITEEGFQISLPEHNELQIDIDSAADMDRFRGCWEMLVRNLEVDPRMLITTSRNGGEHIRVRLPVSKFEPLERIAFQAALGSDPARELLSLLRYRRGDLAPTLFVERAETMKLVAEWQAEGKQEYL